MEFPVLPAEAQSEYDSLADEFLEYARNKKYVEAEDIARRLYDKMLEWQGRYEERFHKGFPLHNIGFSLGEQGKPNVLHYILLAFIEDLIDSEFEDEAYFWPAGQALIKSRYPPKELREIRRIVSQYKEHNEFRRLSRPENVLDQLQKSKEDETELTDVEKKAERNIGRLTKRPIFQDFTDIEKRVFVGGSYELMPTINLIKDLVDELGFEPVSPTDHEKPRGMDDRKMSIALLLTCKYAIFDMSELRGQLVEEEIARANDINSLYICPKGKRRSLTQMLGTERIKGIKTYERFEELKEVFGKFLH